MCFVFCFGCQLSTLPCVHVKPENPSEFRLNVAFCISRKFYKPEIPLAGQKLTAQKVRAIEAYLYIQCHHRHRSTYHVQIFTLQNKSSCYQRCKVTCVYTCTTYIGVRKVLCGNVRYCLALAGGTSLTLVGKTSWLFVFTYRTLESVKKQVSIPVMPF